MQASSCLTALQRLTVKRPMERRRHQMLRWWRRRGRQLRAGLGSPHALRPCRDAALRHAGLSRARCGLRAPDTCERGSSREPGRTSDWCSCRGRRDRLASGAICFTSRVISAPCGASSLAPPFVSLVDVRGRATRRSLDFGLPAALDVASFPCFWTLTAGRVVRARQPARRPSRPPARRQSTRSSTWPAATRTVSGIDLQHGVVDALATS